MSIPLDIVVRPQADHPRHYEAHWNDGGDEERCGHDIPESCLDLFGFMIARQLIQYGNNPQRTLIVRLRGADRELMRAPLGVAAATPLLNYANPVDGPAHCVHYSRETPL